MYSTGKHRLGSPDCSCSGTGGGRSSSQQLRELTDPFLFCYGVPVMWAVLIKARGGYRIDLIIFFRGYALVDHPHRIPHQPGT